MEISPFKFDPLIIEPLVKTLLSIELTCNGEFNTIKLDVAFGDKDDNLYVPFELVTPLI